MTDVLQIKRWTHPDLNRAYGDSSAAVELGKYVLVIYHVADGRNPFKLRLYQKCPPEKSMTGNSGALFETFGPLNWTNKFDELDCDVEDMISARCAAVEIFRKLGALPPEVSDAG
jgi:hypothetical protein